MLLKLRHFSKIKLSNFHRRHHHIERLFPARPHRSPHLLHIRQHVQQTLIETEIPHPIPDLPVLHIKRSVTSHASQNLFVRIDFADVPQAASPAPRARSTPPSDPASSDRSSAQTQCSSALRPSRWGWETRVLSLQSARPYPYIPISSCAPPSPAHTPVASPRLLQSTAAASAATPSPSNGDPDCSGCATSSQISMFSPNSFLPTRSFKKDR